MAGMVKFALIALLVTVCARQAAAEPVQAVGIVFARSIDGSTSGNGVFVGDGTWMITARPVVYASRPAGLHLGEAMVTVLSPYLGEAAEAQVVAHDREAELVLLRLPWKGHPAMSLAREADVLAAAQVDVVGYAGAPASGKVTRTTLGVSGVIVRRSISKTLLTSTAPPGTGWAGAPMVLPDGTLAGCYLRTQADGSAGAALAVGVLRRMIEQTGDATTRTAATSAIAAPPQAAKATEAYLAAITASSSNNPVAALGHFQAFLQLRPNSAVGHRDAAGQLRTLNRLDEAQEMYAKSLELDPQLIFARVLYGQLLHERIMPKAAEEHLRFALRQARSGNAAVIPLCNVLREQRKEAESLQILESALTRNAFDGHLWNYVGQNKRAIGDHAGAAAAFARAGELLALDEGSHIQAGQEFDAAGRSDRAEEQYRLAIRVDDRSGAAHYLLARLIARDRKRQNEALKQAEAALMLAGQAGAPPKDVVESLISAIRSGRVNPADELRL